MRFTRGAQHFLCQTLVYSQVHNLCITYFISGAHLPSSADWQTGMGRRKKVYVELRHFFKHDENIKL